MKYITYDKLSDWEKTIKYIIETTGKFKHWLYISLYYLLNFFFFFCSWGPHLCGTWRFQARVWSELHLPATATATATPDRVTSATHTTAHSNAGCLTHWARKTRDQTRNLMVRSWIRFLCGVRGTPRILNVLKVVSMRISLFWGRSMLRDLRWMALNEKVRISESYFQLGQKKHTHTHKIIYTFIQRNKTEVAKCW